MRCNSYTLQLQTTFCIMTFAKIFWRKSFCAKDLIREKAQPYASYANLGRWNSFCIVRISQFLLNYVPE